MTALLAAGAAVTLDDPDTRTPGIRVAGTVTALGGARWRGVQMARVALADGRTVTTYANRLTPA